MLGVTVPSLKGAVGARCPSSDAPRADPRCPRPPAPLGGPREEAGWWQPSPHSPSPSWHRGPSLPHPQFSLFVPFPRGRGGVVGGLLVLLPFILFLLMTPRGFLAVAGVFLFPLARGRGRCIPGKQYFLITCQKSAAKEPCAPRPQSPAGTTGLFLYGNSSRGPAQPRQGFLLLSAILKTRNKKDI